MKGLFFLVCALGVILQIVSIGKLKKSKDSKYWNMFVGTNAAIFISVAIAYLAFMEDDTLDLGGALVCMFFSALTIVVNVIMLIIGLVQKKKVKYYYFKLNRLAVFVATAIVALNVAIVLVIPFVASKTAKHSVSHAVEEYLSDKYGDHHFKILEIENDYSYNGIVQKYHTGYELTVSSDVTKEDFTIYTYGTGGRNTEIAADEFMGTYLNQTTNEYLAKKYQLEFDAWVQPEQIPKDCGHIPSFDELIEFGAIDDVYIIVKLTDEYNYDADLDGRIRFLRELAKDIRDYLKITKNVTMEFQRWANRNSYSYKLELSGNSLKITGDDKKVYEFDLK